MKLIPQAFLIYAQKVENANIFQMDARHIPFREEFDVIGAFDVIEHIDPKEEAQYMQSIAKSLLPHGVCIIGTPNVTAEAYASDISNEGGLCRR